MGRWGGTIAFMIFLFLSVPTMAEQLPRYPTAPPPAQLPGHSLGKLSQKNVPGVIKNSCEEKTRSLQAIIDKQRELIAELQSEFDKCKEGKNGKK